MRTLFALILLSIVPSVYAQQMSCPEYQPGIFSCTAPETTVYLEYSWSGPEFGTLRLGPTQGIADFLCSPLQPTRQPGGYYTQTVVTGFVEVAIVNYYIYPPSGYIARAPVTCKSPTPQEAGLPAGPVVAYVPPTPEEQDHDIWWFLNLIGGSWSWNVGNGSTNCLVYGLCGGESLYDVQQ